MYGHPGRAPHYSVPLYHSPFIITSTILHVFSRISAYSGHISLTVGVQGGGSKILRGTPVKRGEQPPEKVCCFFRWLLSPFPWLCFSAPLLYRHCFTRVVPSRLAGLSSGKNGGTGCSALEQGQGRSGKWSADVDFAEI